MSNDSNSNTRSGRFPRGAERSRRGDALGRDRGRPVPGGSHEDDRCRGATHGGGIGFFGALTILFIGLKLTNNITWGWGWVLAPLWIPIVVVLAILAFVLLVVVLGAVLGD